MTFSVLIAHYNNYQFFLECYKSLKKQTITNFEIVIVDDCSTDDSFEKIKLITKDDSRVKIYQNEKNNGVGYTKKKSLKLVNGEIFRILKPNYSFISFSI